MKHTILSKTLSVLILIMTYSANAQSLPIKYPSSINNPDDFVVLDFPGGEAIGNCLEANGLGSYTYETRTEHYGNVPHIEKFLNFSCTIKLVDIGNKNPRTSIWWNPVFSKVNDRFIPSVIGKGIVIFASTSADTYGRGSTSNSGVATALIGTCRKTLPPNLYWNKSAPEYKLCNESDFRAKISQFSKEFNEIYLKQNKDKSAQFKYPCVGSSFPGACTRTDGTPYGQCLEYGPPTSIPASSNINCAEIL